MENKEIKMTEDFEIISLGKKETTVYDLEVENTHNFFANDILVHNSNYLRLGPLVDKYFSDKTPEQITNILDKFSKEKIEPFIAECYKELADYMNCFEMEWFMKREVIAQNSVFTGKKRYFMAVLDSEGVRMKEPKIKITGLEAVRSSTPEICRKALKSTMKSILLSDEKSTQDLISNFKRDFRNAHVLDISFPRSVNDIEKWEGAESISVMNETESESESGSVKKGTPIAVRGAIVFNNKMKEKDPLYPTIKSGDKIKFVYLKVPNEFKSNVIALPNELPEALCLNNKIIDKNLQYEKTFIKPLNLILDTIGWSIERQVDLKSFLK